MRGLDTELQVAQSMLARGLDRGAQTVFGSFVVQIRAHAGKSIPVDTAAGPIDAATRVQAVLGP